MSPDTDPVSEAVGDWWQCVLFNPVKATFGGPLLKPFRFRSAHRAAQ